MPRLLFPVLLGAILMGCPPNPCQDRTGGALIHFQIAETHQISLWITNDEFIDEAHANIGEPGRVPVFAQVIAGTDCDQQYSWHVDPEQASWADITIELCDGTPEYIEENLEDWIDQVGQWCPWSAEVIAVEDFR